MLAQLVILALHFGSSFEALRGPLGTPAPCKASCDITAEAARPVIRGADLSQWAQVARLCSDPPRPRPVRHRWWLPTVGFSAQRSLQWSPEGAGFSVATTFWLTLTFPFPSGSPRPPPPDRRRFDELCDAARRLNRVMATVGCARRRTCADLQLLAWRDELEALLDR